MDAASFVREGVQRSDDTSGFAGNLCDRAALEQALSLFSEFVSGHNCKGNIRNTVNELLILPTTIDREKKFLTNDNLLKRFAAEYYEAPVYQREDELLIDFCGKPLDKIKNRESKGYINKG